jgi:hypothetical protein
VAPDGDRFLILAEDMAAREPIRLVLNWVAGLR